VAREQDCTPDIQRGRLAKARAFSDAADLIADLVEDEHDLADAVVTHRIHAGIAAADVICCARLGRHGKREDHHQAVELFERAADKLLQCAKELAG
jgi:hypothetical protein